MHDSQVVQLLERLAKLIEYGFGLELAKLLVLLQPVEEVRFTFILHHKSQEGSILINVYYFRYTRNLGFRYDFKNIYLILLKFKFLRDQALLMYSLDCDLPRVIVFVIGFDHHAVGAFTKHFTITYELVFLN